MVSWITEIIIRCIFSFLSIGREPTTWPANNCLQIMVCSCVVPSQRVLLQIILCSCVLFATDKSRFFAQPRPIIVNYCTVESTFLEPLREKNWFEKSEDWEIGVKLQCLTEDGKRLLVWVNGRGSRNRDSTVSSSGYLVPHGMKGRFKCFPYHAFSKDATFFYTK